MKIVLSLLLLLQSNFTFPDSYTEGLDLSDEDRRMLNDYSSESYNQQALEDLCGKSEASGGLIGKTTLSDACKGSSVKTWGIDEQAISAISKAYSQFALLGNLGGGGNAPAAQANTAQQQAGADAAKEGKNKNDTDYCAFIGAASEQVTGYQQNQYEKYLQNIPTNAENLQTDSLIKIKRNYREKAKNQEINSVAWSGTSVCYVYQTTAGGAAFDFKAGIKIAASAALGFYNGMAAGNHRDLADELNVVIQKMPKNGDCNPITETNCFCNLPENLNNEKYCMPQIRARASRKYGTQVACLDNFGRPDGDCDCIARNSCYDITYMNTLDGISFGDSAEDASAKLMSQISKGSIGKSTNLGTGSLSSNAISKLKNALKKVANEQIGPTNLSSSQKKEAQFFHKLGIPKNLAAALASSPKPSKALLDRTRAKFTPSNKDWDSKSKKDKNRIQDFNNSKNFSMGTSDSSSSSNSSLRNMMKKNMSGSSSNGGKVINYAEKARSQASISNRSDLNIFKIISRRYQLSHEERLK